MMDIPKVVRDNISNYLYAEQYQKVGDKYIYVTKINVEISIRELIVIWRILQKDYIVTNMGIIPERDKWMTLRIECWDKV